ncbi:MAG: hypothetical protein ACREKI_04715 [Gemmatimonadota bacterium]
MTARYTPYELGFAGTPFESQAFPAIEEEAKARGLDPLRREEFTLIASVGAALQDLVPDDSPPDRLDRYADLLYHAFHFWRAGRTTYAFDERVVRFWLEARPEVAGSAARPPRPALYLQWPRNLFWATVSEGTPPEPVDGFFLVARETAIEGRAFTQIAALMAVGLRPGRAGFATIPFRCGVDAAGVPLDAEWMFRSELPGSDLAGIYALERLPEAVRLVEAALWYVDRYPESVRRVSGATTVESGPAALQGPTGLDHFEVTLYPSVPREGGP